MSQVFSSADELTQIQNILYRYMRLPFSTESIPGAIMEGVLAHVRSAKRLNTYDFADVVDEKKQVGWQVKSTKDDTPVTWKRAKIPSAEKLIEKSHKSEAGLQSLGDAIIEFCNQHAVESMKLYKLNEIGYARLLLRDNGTITYFEKLLCSKTKPKLFNTTDFTWRWSKPKKTKKKEQLSALHGFYKPTGKKWWAWHGLGENQLHFSGEHNWWPPKGDAHAVTFRLPSDKDKLRLEDFLALLGKSDLSS